MNQDSSSQVPPKIGKYTIERVLGRGSMGVVYLARDPTIDRAVALKTIVLPKGIDEEKVKEYRARFLREARAAGQLNHPAIVTVYEADDGSSSGIPFIAMEYIDGLPWNQKIRQGVRQNPDSVLPLIGEIASALDYAHRQGVIHRDVKPANIIQIPTGHVKLMDFGIAKVPTSELTQEGQFLGTPAYMSPEQVTGKPLDGRTDIFSLGTVLYELLTCKKPFPGDDVTTVGYRICKEEPKPLLEEVPGISPDVNLIIGHLLAKNPEERYETAHLLVEDIDAYMAGAALPHAGTALPSAGEEKTPSRIKEAEKKAEPAEADGRKKKGWKLPAFVTPLNVLVAFLGLFILITALVGFIRMIRPKKNESPPEIVLSPPERQPAALSSLVASRMHEVTEKGKRVASSQSVPEEVGGISGKTSPSRWRPERPKVKTPLPPSPEPSKATRHSPQTAAPASRSVPAHVTYSFKTGILKGHYELLIDGKKVASKTIKRRFSLRSKTYTGSFTVPPGTHSVTFKVTTKIQDVLRSKTEKVEFSSGEKKTLKLVMTRLNKKLRLEWSK